MMSRLIIDRVLLMPGEVGIEVEVLGTFGKLYFKYFRTVGTGRKAGNHFNASVADGGW